MAKLLTKELKKAQDKYFEAMDTLKYDKPTKEKALKMLKQAKKYGPIAGYNPKKQYEKLEKKYKLSGKETKSKPVKPRKQVSKKKPTPKKQNLDQKIKVAEKKRAKVYKNIEKQTRPHGIDPYAIKNKELEQADKEMNLLREQRRKEKTKENKKKAEKYKKRLEPINKMLDAENKRMMSGNEDFNYATQPGMKTRAKKERAKSNKLLESMKKQKYYEDKIKKLESPAYIKGDKKLMRGEVTKSQKYEVGGFVDMGDRKFKIVKVNKKSVITETGTKYLKDNIVVLPAPKTTPSGDPYIPLSDKLEKKLAKSRNIKPSKDDTLNYSKGFYSDEIKEGAKTAKNIRLMKQKYKIIKEKYPDIGKIRNQPYNKMTTKERAINEKYEKVAGSKYAKYKTKIPKHYEKEALKLFKRNKPENIQDIKKRKTQFKIKENTTSNFTKTPKQRKPITDHSKELKEEYNIVRSLQRIQKRYKKYLEYNENPKITKDKKERTKRLFKKDLNIILKNKNISMKKPYIETIKKQEVYYRPKKKYTKSDQKWNISKPYQYIHTPEKFETKTKTITIKNKKLGGLMFEGKFFSATKKIDFDPRNIKL